MAEHYCYKCSTEMEFAVNVGVKVGRLDSCEECEAKNKLNDLSKGLD